jgi:tetratricopeptide (TPR) repeat protein
MAFSLRTLFGARSRPDAPLPAFSKAHALIQQGRLEPALVTLQEFLATEPRHAEAWYRQGNVLKDLKRPHEALDSYSRAIELAPRYGAAHCNRGVVLLALGNPDDALHEFRRAIDIDPRDAIAHYNRGLAEQWLGQPDAALASYTTALTLNPHYAEAFFSRATLHEESARWSAALSDFEQALALRPGLAPAHFHRGNLLARLKRWDDALASFELAVAGDPGNARAHLHRGNVLRELRQWEAAVAGYDRVIALEPDHADAHFNRAVVLELCKRFPEALQAFERAISLRPDFAAAQYNRALLQLQTGNFGAGFANYEWRWKNRSAGFDPATYQGDAPLWSGQESLEGRRILVFSEQGLGDTLQFCRYLRLVAGLGAHVIFEVQAPLAGLLATIEGAATVIPRGDPIPACDIKCALLSLPLALETRVDTIPAGHKYIHADPGAVAAWQARLGPRTRPRIGLAWSGNPQYPNDDRRSIPLATLIERLPREFEYFCLQKDIRPEDRATLDACRFIADPAADWVYTAALCECMDVVISACTSIAHLAGALYRPVWVLLAYNADWRWLEDRDDSPWYPTARLYRQSAPGGWGGVAARVAADLRRTFAQPAGPSVAATAGHVSG